MDKAKLYNGFTKLCSAISKTNITTFVFSNGTYSAIKDGLLTTITANEKLEAEILPFLYKKYLINVKVINFMNEYFKFYDVVFSNDGIEFVYTVGDIVSATKSKLAASVFSIITKDGDYYYYRVEYDDTCDVEILSFLYKLNGVLNFETVEESLQDIYSHFANNERPLDIRMGKNFFVRLAKSIFLTVTKGDVAKIRCFEYIDDRIVFLTTTTVNKKDIQIVNIFNSLYLPKEA